MKKQIAIVAVVALLAGCGGNYSNDDLAFLNALPHREDLQAKAPGNSGTTQSGLQTRRDGLSVGDPSKVYADTKDASVKFNGLLEVFLGLVDTVRKLPPTTRTEGSRIWGPFKDDKHPDFDIEMVMTREADDFHWVIEFRRHDAAKSDPWIPALNGAFKASSGVRKGKGELHLFMDKIRAAGIADNDDGKLAQLDVTYVTDELPVKVDMQATATAGNASLNYSYREFEPGAASIVFVIDNRKTDGTSLDIRSGWNATGAGKANIVHTAANGTQTEVSPSECWDSQFKVTYFNTPWVFLGPSSGGDATTCPVVQGI